MADDRNETTNQNQDNVAQGGRQAQTGRGEQSGSGNADLSRGEPTDTLQDRNVSGADTWRTLDTDQNSNDRDGGA